jgi:hypothetical protein
VQGRRDDALAGAVLSGDEHVGVGGSDSGHQFENGAHRRRLREQVGGRLVAQRAVLGLQALTAPNGARQLGLRADDRDQALVVPGLLHEVPGPAAHRLHGNVDRAPGRHHDHRQRGIDRPDAREQVETLAARCRVACVIEVHEDDIELAVFDGVDRADRGGRRFEFPPFGLQQEAKRLEHIGLVVGNQDAQALAV